MTDVTVGISGHPGGFISFVRSTRRCEVRLCHSLRWPVGFAQFLPFGQQAVTLPHYGFGAGLRPIGAGSLPSQRLRADGPQPQPPVSVRRWSPPLPRPAQWSEPHTRWHASVGYSPNTQPGHHAQPRPSRLLPRRCPARHRRAPPWPASWSWPPRTRPGNGHGLAPQRDEPGLNHGRRPGHGLSLGFALIPRAGGFRGHAHAHPGPLPPRPRRHRQSPLRPAPRPPPRHAAPMSAAPTRSPSHLSIVSNSVTRFQGYHF